MTKTATDNLGCRLSESPIWEIQEKFYADKGIEAWRTEGIPSLVSTNAHVARVYTEAFLAWAADLADRIDRRHPLTIVELGSGTGRLAFLILRTIERLKPLWPELADVTIRYVMTDITDKTLDFWQRHPPLRPFFEDGRLDLGIWTSRQGAELTLRRSGEELGGENPIAIVANYVFDSLAQDAFHVIDGQLHEARAALRQNDRQTIESPEGRELEELTVEFHDFRVSPEGYYDDADLDGILATYQKTLGDASVLVPVAAIRAVRALAEKAGGRVLLLASDKGEGRTQSFEGVWNWPLTLHGGCFSLMANMHAVGLFFEQRGGLALQSPDPRDLFRFCVCALGDERFSALRRAVESTLSAFNFRDLLALAKHVEGKPDLDRALAVAKLSDYDPYVFGEIAQGIEEGLEELDELDRAATLMVLRRVSENDYHLGDHLDLPFLVGRLFYQCNEFDEALEHYEASLRESGDHEATLFNIGLCWESKGDFDKAIELFRRSLEVKPGYELSQERLDGLLKKLGRTP